MIPAFREPAYAMTMLALTLVVLLFWVDGWLAVAALAMAIVCALGALSALLQGVRPTDETD